MTRRDRLVLVAGAILGGRPKPIGADDEVREADAALRLARILEERADVEFERRARAGRIA